MCLKEDDAVVLHSVYCEDTKGGRYDPRDSYQYWKRFIANNSYPYGAIACRSNGGWFGHRYISNGYERP